MTDQSTSDSALRIRRSELRKSSRPLAGNGFEDPALELERVAAWCREQSVEADSYGSGEFLQGFEAHVADLLGFEAARFMPSGTMAQPIALRIWSGRAGNRHVGMHPTCHLELHEQRGYSWLHGLSASLVGIPQRPMLAKDLSAIPEAMSALVVELPTRENGGQLPSWEELKELVQLAQSRGTRLHLDGARLWEAQASYQRPFSEICAHFDSAYVSFYKGIGALPGSMLLGSRDFIDEAILWQRRQGGNLYSSLANAASAAMRLEAQLAKIPLYLQRAGELGPKLHALDGLRVLPTPPQVNMFHVFFDSNPTPLLTARDQVAEETGIWLFGGVRPDQCPGSSRTEITLADSVLALEDKKIIAAFERLMCVARDA
ncbi:MAG: threonine aldolase [Planctomycetota bacterium]|jgi:threonine aldolase